jgi:hypothetical protein
MRRIVALMVLSVLAACGGDSSTSASASVVGTWNLTSVNGAALPFIASAANPKVEVLSDQYVITSSGTFTETTTLRVTQGTAVTTQTSPESGTYTTSGTAVNLKYASDGSTETGTFSGNTLTFSSSGFSAVYTRQ